MKKIILTLLPISTLIACSSATPPILNNQIQNAKEDASIAENYNPQILNIKLASVPTKTLEKSNITNILKTGSYNNIADTNVLCVNKESMVLCENSWYEENAYLNKVNQNQNSVALSSRISISGIKLKAQSIYDKTITFNITSQLISNVTQNSLGEQTVSTSVYKNIATITPINNIYVIKPYPPQPLSKNNITYNSTFNNQNSYILIFNYLPSESKNLNQIKNLNTKYLIKGGEDYQKPLQIFDDGNLTYIKLTRDYILFNAPYVTTNINGTETKVNFRIKKDYIIVDGVWSNLNLHLNYGLQKETIVKIQNNN